MKRPDGMRLEENDQQEDGVMSSCYDPGVHFFFILFSKNGHRRLNGYAVIGRGLRVFARTEEIIEPVVRPSFDHDNGRRIRPPR